MPLTFTGHTVDTESGLSIQAKDSAGNNVPVKASYEAMQDYGLDRVQKVANSKFERGEIEKDGSVLVRTSDCTQSR